MKYLIKKLLTLVIYYSGFIWLFEYLRDLFSKNNKAIILGYHHLYEKDHPSGEPSTIYSSKQKFDKLVLDPPRAGAKEILENLSNWQQPQSIVYISCNPATFVRDAKLICQPGYELDKLCVMNMFPHTGHVEVMGKFVKF